MCDMGQYRKVTVMNRRELVHTARAIGLASCWNTGSIALFVAAVLYPSCGNGQTVEWASSASAPGGATSGAVGVDAAGNSYIAGTFGGTATFGSIVLTSVTDYDLFVAKVDSAGNFLWAHSPGGSINPLNVDIDVDAAGNSYVSANFYGVLDFGGPFVFTAQGLSYDLVVAKYDPDGNVFWARSAQGVGLPSGIALDASGNCYVSGSFNSTSTFGSFVLSPLAPGDQFLVKYNSNGIEQFASQTGGGISKSGYIYLHDIAVDGAGNSYVTGYYTGTIAFGPFVLTNDIGTSSMLVGKYNSTGDVVWVRSSGGAYPATTRGDAIAADAAGNSYLTGRFEPTATIDEFELASAGYQDVFVAKYDTDGNVLWARSGGGPNYDGPGGGDGGSGIALDASGNSYIFGYYLLGPATFGAFVLSADYGLFMAKYDSAGTVVSAWLAGEPNAFFQDYGMAVDADGGSYATGGYIGTTTFDPFVLTGNGVFVTRYSASAADADADGVPDATDNCPNAANADQLDADNDDVGDVCDCDLLGCSDGNPCTDDVCDGANCSFPNNTIACDDGDPGTENDVCTNGFCAGTPITIFGDINGSGTVNLDDILCILACFGSNCACADGLANADIVPCGGNGVVNLDDILAILAAFAGADLCQ